MHAFMMVNAKILSPALAAVAALCAASAVAAPTPHLGLPPPAQPAHLHVRFAQPMFEHRQANRYPTYGYYGGYGSPYAVADNTAAAPLYAQPVEAPVAVAPVTPYNSDKVCPVIWRWSARAGQAVRSWSYCNN